MPQFKVITLLNNNSIFECQRKACGKLIYQKTKPDKCPHCGGSKIKEVGTAWKTKQ